MTLLSDGGCHAHVGKPKEMYHPCGLDASHYAVKRRNTGTFTEGPTVTVWFCAVHHDKAIKEGWELTLIP
jgi:hypothetical protein